MIRKIVLSYLFTLILLPALSQTVISGNISDSAGRAVSGATVTYRKLNAGIILGFSLSDPKGLFSLQFSVPDDSILINVKHLGYEEQSLHIKNQPQKLTINLTPKIQILPNVTVTLPPIYKQKDTVNYLVNAFTSKEDRVIADIIKKLPGIEMEGEKILYQGKAIQKYFINGLDLLEGRYSLANNNLPVDAVRKVQVIENDQPIKILDSLIFSDRASLNVQLKKFTNTGSAKLGVGFTPLLRDVNITPMTFNKNFQAINSFQSNNIGDDVSKQLDAITAGTFFDYADFANVSGNNTPTPFVGLQEIGAPVLNERKWLNNNVNMLSSNSLQKLQNNLELKGNLSYINDFRKRSGETHTTLFTPGQRIDIFEGISNSYNLNNVAGNFILLKNEKNIYFKNSLQISKQWSGNNGLVQKNGSENIDQRRELQNINFSNKFSAAAFWGKQLVNINSSVGYKRTPQRLFVVPGQFKTTLNNEIPYQRVLQDVQFTKYGTDNYLSFVKGFKSFSLMPRFGISYQRQQLQSDISLTDFEQSERILGNDYTNQLIFVSTIGYFDMTSQYRKDRISIDITTPLRIRKYLVKDDIREIRNALSRLTFEPRLLFIYRLKAYWEARASSGYSNQYGEMSSLYNAYLLTSYRNLQRFNASIPESNSWNSSVSFNYSNVLKSIFSNISYSYNLGRRNYLFRNKIDENGFNTIEMSSQNNSQTTHLVAGSYSKYLSKIKTIVKLGGNVGWSRSDYLLNNSFEVMNSRAYGGSVEINNTSLKYLGFQYESRVSLMNSSLSGDPLDKIVTNTNTFNISIYPIDNHAINLNTEYYVTNLKAQKNQLFIDLNYRTGIPKKRIDFEFSWVNLLNNDTYIRLYTSEFSIVRSFFQLRPRQLLAAVKFKF